MCSPPYDREKILTHGEGYELPEVVDRFHARQYPQPHSYLPEHDPRKTQPDHSAPQVIDTTSPEVQGPRSPYASELGPSDHVAAYYAPSYDDRSFRDVPRPPAKKRKFRRRLIVIPLLVLIVLLIGAGIGTGLGIALKGKGTAKSGAVSGNSTSTAPTTSTPSISATATSSAPTPSGGNSNTTTSTPSSRLQVLLDTGLAATPRGDGAGMLLYYQAADGKVYEEYHADDSLSVQDLTKSAPVGTGRTAIDLPGFAQGGQISAASYMLGNVIWRHLFYIDNSGYTRLTNTSGNGGAWSTPSVLGVQAQRSDSSSLSSCFGSDSGNSLHVFYGGSDGLLYEAINYLNDSSPNAWQVGNNGNFLYQPTSSRGCACGIFRQNDGVKRVVLFAGNNSDSNLMHLKRDFDRPTSWTVVDENNMIIDGPRRVNVSLHHNMALVTKPDKTATYLFWHGEDGLIKQAFYPADASGQYSSTLSWPNAVMPQDSKLAAYWPSSSPDAPVLFYQGSDRSSVLVSALDKDRGVVANSTLGQ